MSSASELRESEGSPGARTVTRMGPKPALTLEGIADAAVTIADAEGIGAVSMQRVAAEFAYTKMSLYRYVKGKDELIAAMIDRAVGDPPVLAAARGWRKPLEAWIRLLADTWERHPWLPLATGRWVRTRSRGSTGRSTPSPTPSSGRVSKRPSCC